MQAAGRGARRSFLGLQVRLDRVPAERVEELVREAWRQQAPKRVVAAVDDLALRALEQFDGR